MPKFYNIFLVLSFSLISLDSLADDQATSTKREYQPTILLSIDGFAHHYLKQYKPQNILKLAKNGVNAEALISVFPTKTFPNHLSIVTGNYPAKHGLVHNRFYNRELNKNYKLGIGKLDERWLTSPAIWSIAEKNNIKTAIYFWPESEIDIKQYKPTYSLPYKHNTPNIDRLNQIIDWLKLPVSTRPELILGYFSTVDTAGHDFGINSNELKSSIQDIDKLLGNFIKRLENEISVPVNIILVSDHGMIDTPEQSIPYFHLFDGVDTVQVVNGQTQLYVYLKDQNQESAVLAKIKKNMKSKHSEHVNVYKYDEYPESWHFNTRSSVMPNLILEVLPPYTFATSKTEGPATHGFAPNLSSSLDAIFIANGPSFKKKLEIKPFENIHILPLVLEIYGIDVDEKIDGKKSILHPILK